MTKLKTILSCVLLAVLSGCVNPSPAEPPSAEIGLPEALRRSIFEHEGKSYYKIHIDSDEMTRISGRIVSHDELMNIMKHDYDPEIGVYLAVYGIQEPGITNAVQESLMQGGVRDISMNVADEESEIMQKQQ